MSTGRRPQPAEPEDHDLTRLRTAGSGRDRHRDGFPSATDIRIWLQGSQAEARSDGSGGFTVTFKVPRTSFAGITDVIASGGAFSDSALFTIEGS